MSFLDLTMMKESFKNKSYYQDTQKKIGIGQKLAFIVLVIMYLQKFPLSLF